MGVKLKHSILCKLCHTSDNANNLIYRLYQRDWKYQNTFCVESTVFHILQKLLSINMIACPGDAELIMLDTF